ncbi:aspartate aminotransferase, mitochondrial-like [Chironomus tepperi]|uniref:aspartate aminotransferase, mitochondrial-like n=1 Tax=Chironomus tepperi TaxID=113505 RepID=UPI00391FBD83
MVRLTAFLRDPLKLKQAVAPAITSWWKDVPLGPPDVILGIYEAHKVDPNPNKVDLTVGAYRCENGKPYVLKTVLKAEQNIVDKKLSKEYNDIGSDYFREVTYRLAVGEELCDRPHVSVQSISGSGSIKMAAEVIKRLYKGKHLMFIPNPSWAYHAPMFELSGIDTAFYRYYDERNHEIDHSGLMTDLTHMPDNSMVMFQMVGHNPTASDPTPEQWQEMARILKHKNVLVFFDMAYQGFGSGCTETDAYAVRHFIKEGHKVAFAQSYSKNLGMYSVRVGAATFMINGPNEAQPIMDQMKYLAMCSYGQPPMHGSQVVEEIFRDRTLQQSWHEELHMMVDRIKKMRELLTMKLKACGSSHDWSHIMKQQGMFFFSGLTVEQCEKLINEHSIYVVKNGRMAIPGINENNVDYVAECLHHVTK